MNPDCMKLDRVPSCTSQCLFQNAHLQPEIQNTSKSEIGVESYSEATMSKYIHRSGTTLRAVVRGGVGGGG